MNLAILNVNAKVVTMSSREIAELTGKQHKHVRVDIAKMLVELQEDEPTFRHIYFDSMNREQREYEITKELTEVLLTGYSAKLRRIVIARWHELETKQAAPTTLSTMDILTLAMESEKGRLLAVEQRDAAIATKAQIGSKKVATAMATASHLKRENNKLKDELGFNTLHATVKAVKAATGSIHRWLPLRKWCEANNQLAKNVTDPLYGEVKAWPAGAWREVYGINLVVLFSGVAA